MDEEQGERPGSGDAPGVTIFTRAFQFFLVPALIVLACAGLYWFFTYTLSSRQMPADWVRELRQGGPVARKHAAAQLAAELRRQAAPGGTRDLSLVQPILAVFTSLDAPDPDSRQVRQLLAKCLGLLGDTRATPHLLDVLKKDDDPETKAACIDAIGALRDSDAAEDLIKLLDHPSSIVRKYAAFTLGALAAPKRKGQPPAVPAAVEPLKTRLKDVRPEVQWNAAFALAFYLQDGSGAPVLRRMLDRKHVTEVVASSSREPGEVGEATVAAAPALIAHVMQMACQGVAALKDGSFVPQLEAVASEDPDLTVRDVARKTLDVLRRS